MPEPTRNGTPLVLDLAQRERAEKALRESEAKFRLVVESNMIGILFWDLAGAILYANDAFLAMTGYDRDDLNAGRLCWREMTPPEFKHLDDLAVEEIKTKGRCTPFEKEYFRKDGSRVSILLGGAQLHSSDQGVCFVLDISARKRAENALRESEERHRLITELTSDYTYTAAVHADGRVEVDSMSDGFTRVTGYTLEEIVRGGGWQALIHPDELDLVQRRGPKVLLGQSDVDEIRIRTKTGETRWIRYSTRPMWDGAAGRVVRLLGAVQDITEQRQAETALHDFAQRHQALSRRLLEVQEQERRYLARELHDEIGQFLTGLNLTLEAARHPGTADAEACLSQAQSLVKDLSARVRDLSLRLRPTMLDDLGLIPALLWLFDGYTVRTKVRVSFEHHGLSDRLAPATETAAYRIVQESLTNVARHAAVAEVTVRAYLAEGHLHLVIEDLGRGFEDDEAKSGEHSAGLSGMQERAFLLGGRLSVESCLGRGTRIVATLPAEKRTPLC